MKMNKFLILGVSAMMIVACKKEGCTDPTAMNYDSKANSDNGTCIYEDGSGGGNTGGGNNGGGGNTNLPIQITDAMSGTTIQNQSTNPGVADYYIDGTWDISAATVIEPGVRIMMKAGAQVHVLENGSLNATGTPSMPIEIFGEQGTPGYWLTIEYYSNNLNNKLIYCSISDGGHESGEEGMITLDDGAKLIIQNSNFTNGDWYGVYLSYASAQLPNFQNNHFSGMGKEPFACLTFEQAQCLDNTTTFNNNGIDKVYVDGTSYSSNVTLHPISIPYYVATDFNISGGNTIFEAGVHIEMGPGAGFYVLTSASLQSNGTSSNHVTIDATPTAGKGYWGNIQFDSNNTTNLLQYTDISDGGSTSGEDAMVYLNGTAWLKMLNCTVSNGSAKAVNGDSGATLTGSGNTWSSCDGGGGLLP